MKKSFFLLLSLLTSMTIMADEVSYTYEQVTLKYDVSNGVATVKDGKTINAPKVIIPDYIQVGGVQYQVTSISEEAFTTWEWDEKGSNKKYTGNSTINFVVIPKSIKNIQARAFYNCSNLRLVEFEGTIPEMEADAFKGCSSLDYVGCNSTKAGLTLPKESSKFPNNSTMTLYVPVGSATNASYLKPDYNWKDRFGNRIYEGKMKIIHSSQYNMDFVCATGAGASSKATLYIGKDEDSEIPTSFVGDDNNTYSVVGIGRPGFSGCTNLQKLKIKGTLEYITNGAFYNCSRLAYICLRQTSTLAYNPTSVFPNNGVMALFVPESTVSDTYFGSGWDSKQFRDRIYKGDMVERSDAAGMKYICADRANGEAILTKGIDNTVVTIKNSFVDGKTYKVKGIGRSAFYDFKTNLDSLIIEDGVTAIFNSAFQNCSKLQKLDIPASLSTIGKDAFAGCSNLVHIRCRVENPGSLDPTYLPGNTVADLRTLYVNSTDVKAAYDINTKWNNEKFGDRIYVGDIEEVPANGMTYFRASISHETTLFKGKDDITNVPDIVDGYNVTAIDRSAFSGFTSIVSLKIPENIKEIGPEAFKGCSNLKTVELPSSLEKIKDKAFDNCNSLVSVVCKNASPISISDNVFSSTRNLYVPVKPVNSVNAYKSADGWKKFAVIMGGPMKDVNYDGSKYNCATGTEEAVLIVGNKESKAVTIHSFIEDKDDDNKKYKVIAIDKEAFLKANLEQLTFEDGENSIEIEEKAFDGCSKLRILTFPTKLTKIGSQAFNACDNLEYVISKSATPPTAAEKVFTTNMATLYVPTGSKTAYQAATGWSSITSLVECNDMNIVDQDGLTYALQSQSSDESELRTATVIKGLTPVAPDNGILPIPDKITWGNNDYSVVAIAASAFNGNTNIKELRLSEGVETIGSNAFKGCKNLSTISLPSTLTAIGESAFENTAITNLVIRNGVKEIGIGAFRGCGNNLVEIELPASLNSIGNQAFADCGKINRITSKIPKEKLETLCDNIGYVFTSQISPTIYIPSQSKEEYVAKWGTIFGENLFVEGNYGEGQDANGWNYEFINGDENTATLINALKVIENDDPLVVPGSVKIGSETYKVTEIAESAFKDYPGKSNITKLSIEENIKKIGANAFQGFSSLQKIWLPKSLTSIGSKAFDSCNAIAYVFSEAESPSAINDNVFSVGTTNTATLFVPEGKKDKYIDGWVNKISNVVEGAYVRDKEDGGMTYVCYKVKNAAIEGQEVTYTRSAILTKATTTISEALIGSEVKVSEEGSDELLSYKVISIGKYAFRNCTNLSKLELPATLTSIGDHAFDGCNKIKTIISAIPGGSLGSVNSDYSKVFESVLSPEVIYVPVGSKDAYKVSWNMFAENLFKPGTPGYNKQSPESSGWYYNYLTTVDESNPGEGVEFYGTATLISAEKGATDVNGLLTIPGEILIDGKKYEVTRIDNNAFDKYLNKANDVKQLKISENITSIGENALRNFTGVQQIWLPKSLTTISSKAFDGCNAITHVFSKMDSPSAMSNDMFSIPTANTATIIVPTKVGYNNVVLDRFSNVVVGDYVRDKEDGGMTYVCYKVKNAAIEGQEVTYTRLAILTKATATISEALIESEINVSEEGSDELHPYKVISIGKYAFRNCANLSKLELPATLTSIGDHAFDGCNKIKTIISAIPGGSLGSVNSDYSKVFESVLSPEVIYVPVGSKDAYKVSWNMFAENLFKPGTPGYNKQSPESSGWYYNYLTTVDESNPGEGVEFYGTATLISAEKGATDVNGLLTIPGEILIDGKKYEVTRIDNNAFDKYLNKANDVKQLKISENITSIGENALRNFTGVQQIWLPKSLTTISSKAFDGCNAITHVFSKMDSPSAMSDDMFSIPTVNTATIIVPTKVGYNDVVLDRFSNVVVGDYVKDKEDGGMTFVSYKVKDDVEEGQEVTYTRLAILTKATATISEALIKSEIKVSEEGSDELLSYKVISIGKYAFRNCANLSKLELPATLTSIGDNAFDGCNKIKTIISAIPGGSLGSVNSDYSKVFASGLSPEVIYVPVGSKDAYKVSWNMFAENLFKPGTPGYNKQSPESSGWYYNYLTTVDESNPGEGVEFYGTATLISAEKGATDVNGLLTIPGEILIDGKKYEVTRIDNNAFDKYLNKANDVKQLKISENITSIGENALRNFTSVQQIWLPKSLTTISSKAFDGCNAITHVFSKMDSPSAMSDDMFSIPTVNTATIIVPTKVGYNNVVLDRFSNVVVGDYVKDKEDGGMTFVSYKVKDDVEEGQEVTYTRLAILTKATATISEALIESEIKVSEEGSDELLSYKVISIGKYAFRNCTNLSKLKLPATLTSIGDHAFDGCNKIKTIISAIPGGSLGSLNSDYSKVFESVLSPEVIYVPVGSKDVYKAAWNMFAENLFKPGTPGYNKESDGGSGWYYNYLTTVDESNPGEGVEIYGTATLISAEKGATDVNGLLPIPGEVFIDGKKYEVTRIDNNAFDKYPNKANDVKQLKISENITSIGENALRNFTGVQQIWLPKSLTTISSKAFDGCNSISYVFSKMESPSALSDDIFSIPTGNTATLFVPSTTGYTSVVLGKFSNVIEGEYVADKEDGGMIYACYKVKGEGDEAPDKTFAILTKPIAKNITEAQISKSVKTDGSDEDYVVTRIGKCAFKDCTQLTKIVLPISIESIGDFAFDGCTISNIVSDIEDVFEIKDENKVFTNDTYSTATLYVPQASYDNYKNTVGWKKFAEGTDRIVKGKWEVSEFMGDKNCLKFKYHTGTHEAEIIEISFPENPDVNQRTLTIDNSYKLEGNNVVYYVNSIAPTKITNGNLIEKLIINKGNKELTIGAEAFKGCSNLATLKLPSNLTIIDSRAFFGCSNLSKIELSSDTRLSTIGVGAFQNCTSLQNIWLPASLTSIGSKAFNGCSNLTRVSTETVLPIDKDVFSTYKTAILFVPTGTLASVGGKAGWESFSRKYEGRYVYETPSEKDITYIYLKQQTGDKKTAVLTKSTATQITTPVSYEGEEYDVTIIGESVFSGKDLGEIERLPEGIVTIEKEAFKSSKLKKLLLPSTLKNIGDGAFSGNTQLTELTFADNLEKNLETIGDNAFKGCSSLQKFELPQTLKSIGVEAFANNTNFVDLVLPEGIETIKEYAFQNCSGLKNFQLPSTLTAIGANIFDGCSSLAEVISKIKTKDDIESNAQSLANAILYVPQGTGEDYEKAGWDFLHIIEGDRKTTTEAGVEYAYGDKEAIVIGITDNGIKDGAVTIPGTVIIGKDEYDVIDIEKGLLSGNTNVKSVTIGENVKTIGTNAFKGCSNLRKLELPSTLTSIGENAFDGCNNLAEVVCYSQDYDFIGSNKQSFPYATLYVPKKSLYEKVWDYAQIYEGERTLEPWNGMTFACFTGVDTKEAILVDATETKATDGMITIPSKIIIGEGDSAEDYDVVAIASKAFSGNTDVKLVELPATLTSIDSYAFEGCKNLSEVVSKIDSIEVINDIKLSLPDAILFVPSVQDANLVDVYKTGWNFAHIYAGERKTDTQNGMSYVCATGDKEAILVKGEEDQLDQNITITIPSSITITVGEGESTEELECKCKVVAIAANAFKDLTGIKTVKIEENVKSIGTSAFDGCSSLNKVWLPESIESIADKAFYNTNIDYICTKRGTPIESPNMGESVFYPKKATVYVPVGGALADYDTSDFWKTFPIRREGYFVGVTTKKDQDEKGKNKLTFECLDNGENAKVAILTKADINDPSVVDIQSTVKLDNTDTVYKVTTICKDAFNSNDSKNLVKIVLPETLSKIEDEAFKLCTKLAVITSKVTKENLFKFNENVFPEDRYESDGALVYIPYDEDGSTEAKYKDTDGWKEFKNWAQGEKKTATVGDLTYDYLVGVGTATITKAATTITKISIDGSVTIDGAAYKVEAIGPNAFKGCNNLKMVWLPATLKNIDQTAFSGCNSITYVSSAIDNPTATNANIFPSAATLFVPQGHKSNYDIGGWNNFAYVAEGKFVDVVTTDNSMTFDCYTDNSGNKKAILKKYNANPSVVEIPVSVNSYTVSIITKQAFTSKTNMESLIIPSGVEAIDAETFSACSKLKWIESKIVNPIDITGKNVFANNTATLFIPSSNVDVYSSKGWNFLNIFVGDKKETVVDGWTYVYSTVDKKAVLTKVGSVNKNVTIKATFKIGKDEFAVTSIAETVFKGKTNIEALTLSKNIQYIGANAFDGCNNLVSITCEGTIPPMVGTNAFPSYSVTVNVPKDAVTAYKNHDYWKQFGNNILGITTSVEDDPSGQYITDEVTHEAKIWDGSNEKGDATIDEIVTINGSDYRVTGIAEKAYADNTDLTSIVIPSSITSIGASAFAGCKNLKSITVNIVTPIALPTVAGARGMTRAGGSSVFEGVNKETCILYVPAGSVDAYKKAAGWNEFKKIYAIGTTAINGVVVSEGSPFDVYNMQGRKVKANTTTLNGLPSGVYIVNGKKVMVK